MVMAMLMSRYEMKSHLTCDISPFFPFSPECNDALVDMVFVVDASTSVTEYNFLVMKDFIKDFLFNANIDDGNVRVGIIIYSTEDYLQFHLNEHKDKLALFTAIDDIPYRYGSTNTADALNTMRTQMYTEANGDRPGVPNVAIVITDGVSNINSRRTIPEAEQARAEGIHIYAIGIGLTDTTELEGIASKPVDENLFSVKEFSELRNLRSKVFTALCASRCLNVRLISKIQTRKLKCLHIINSTISLLPCQGLSDKL